MRRLSMDTRLMVQMVQTMVAISQQLEIYEQEYMGRVRILRVSSKVMLKCMHLMEKVLY